MSEENINKRIANDNLIFDENEENHQGSKSLKVAVISGSSNVANFQENSVILRDDLSKVIIKVQKSPVQKQSLKELDVDMEDNPSDENESREEKANISQKIYESILVN